MSTKRENLTAMTITLPHGIVVRCEHMTGEDEYSVDVFVIRAPGVVAYLDPRTPLIVAQKSGERYYQSVKLVAETNDAQEYLREVIAATDPIKAQRGQRICVDEISCELAEYEVSMNAAYEVAALLTEMLRLDLLDD